MHLKLIKKNFDVTVPITKYTMNDFAFFVYKYG